jgi:hypothetical protein
MTDLKYPMVDLFTGPIMMSLMYLNILAAWYLLFLTAPWLFMQPWMRGLEGERGFIEKSAAEGQNGENPRRLRRAK